VTLIGELSKGVTCESHPHIEETDRI